MIDKFQIAYTAADIASIRRSLEPVRERWQSATLSPEDQGEITSALHRCRLVLDRAMNAVWQAHNTMKPGVTKADVYFPCCPSIGKFADALSQRQLADLEQSNVAAYRVIFARQPFASAENAWLQKLMDLTKNKHQVYVDLTGYLVWETNEERGSPNLGHDQAEPVVATADDKPHTSRTDADRQAPAEAPFRLRLEQRFTATNLDALSFCEDCIAKVEEVFGEVVATLPGGGGA